MFNNNNRHKIYSCAYEFYKQCNKGKALAERYMENSDNIKTSAEADMLYEKLLEEREDFCDSLYMKVMDLRCKSIWIIFVSLSLFFDILFVEALNYPPVKDDYGILFLLAAYGIMLTSISVILWIKLFYKKKPFRL